jgi:hypothetical protein
MKWRKIEGRNEWQPEIFLIDFAIIQEGEKFNLFTEGELRAEGCDSLEEAQRTAEMIDRCNPTDTDESDATQEDQ